MPSWGIGIDWVVPSFPVKSSPPGCLTVLDILDVGDPCIMNLHWATKKEWDGMGTTPEASRERRFDLMVNVTRLAYIKHLGPGTVKFARFGLRAATLGKVARSHGKCLFLNVVPILGTISCITLNVTSLPPSFEFARFPNCWCALLNHQHQGNLRVPRATAIPLKKQKPLRGTCEPLKGSTSPVTPMLKDQ